MSNTPSRRGLFGLIAAAAMAPAAVEAMTKPALGLPGNPVVGVPLRPDEVLVSSDRRSVKDDNGFFLVHHADGSIGYIPVFNHFEAEA